MEAIDVMAAALRMQSAGRPYALVSVLHAEAPVAARPGDKAVVDAGGIVCGWIGGGCAQPAVLKAAARALSDGKARRLRIATLSATDGRESGDVMEVGMTCHSGGVLELFVDPILPLPQLLVVGASPVAVTLSKLAPLVGFSVTVAAAARAREAFAEAVAFVELDGSEPPQIRLHPGAYAVVATQGQGDLEGLRLALTAQPRYLGFVASARKAEALKHSLREAGFATEAVTAVIAPAGVPIHARTPEEIALSVLAGVVAARRASEAVQLPMQSMTGAALVQPAANNAALAGSGSASCCHAAEPAETKAVPVSSSSCGGEHGMSA